MLIVPYSTDLALGRRPYVTWSVIALCLCIHLLAVYREGVVTERMEDYCDGVATPAGESFFDRYWEDPQYGCQFILFTRHSYETASDFQHEIISSNKDEANLPPQELREVLNQIERHYNRATVSLPSYLQDVLQHDPRSLNPLPMLTSTFAHDDWMHLVGNLVFFFAFAAAVEAIVGPIVFLVAFAVLSLVCGIAYSAFCLFSESWIPTIGLSGIVMGVIGVAGYLMPKARINTLLASGLIGWRFAIPAWALAAFFILTDLFNLLGAGMAESTTNFLSHVVGGLGGYLGAILFLKPIKAERADEVDDAIELAAIRRIDSRDSLAKEPITRRQLRAEIRAQAQRKEQERFSQELFRSVRVGNSTRVMLLLMKEFDTWQRSPEIYEQLFNEIGEIKRSRAWLCAGRLCVHLYAGMGRYGKAVAIAEVLATAYPHLELASASEALQVAHEAIGMNRSALAAALLEQPEKRYRGLLDLSEAERLLSQCERNVDLARELSHT